MKINIPEIHEDTLFYNTSRNNWKCDICFYPYDKTDPSFYCQQCDFDCCCDCLQLATKENFSNPVHPHKFIISKKQDHFCSLCEQRFARNAFFVCNSCNLNICFICMKLIEKKALILREAHGCPLFITVLNNWTCDICKKSKVNWPSLGCRQCDFDVCFTCMNEIVPNYQATIIPSIEKNLSFPNNQNHNENINIDPMPIEEVNIPDRTNLRGRHLQSSFQEVVNFPNCDPNLPLTFKVDNVSPRGDLFRTTTANAMFSPFDVCSIDSNRNFVHFGPVPFLTGVYQAYCQHFPLSFSPDDFWTLIIQAFSNHVNANSEKLRHLFVNFSGKKELIAKLNLSFRREMRLEHYEDCITQIVNQIPKYIQPSLIQALEPDFSTTTKNIKYVGKLSIMSSFKKYFDYRIALLGCGIPSITLQGTVEDWENILTKIEQLKNKEFDWWLCEIIPIIKKIIEAKKGNIDVIFWREMIKQIKDQKSVSLSGRLSYWETDYITGWITKFFPFTKEGKSLLQNKIEVKEIEKLASQILQIPFVLFELVTNKKYDMIFNAGFLGCDQDNMSYTVSPLLGWFITEGKIDPNNIL